MTSIDLPAMSEEQAAKRSKLTGPGHDLPRAASPPPPSQASRREPRQDPVGCAPPWKPYDTTNLKKLAEPAYQRNLPSVVHWAVCVGRLDVLRRIFEDTQLTGIALAQSLEQPLSVGEHPNPAYRLNRRFGPYYERIYETNCHSPGNIRVACNIPGLHVPLLVHACEHGHADIVDYFIEKGANINIYADVCHYSDADSRNFYARTPLIAAIRGGFDDIASMLIERGAVLTPMETKIIRRRSSDEFYGKEVTVNFTALCRASSNGSVSLVQKMIDHGLLNASSARYEDDRPLTKKQQTYAQNLVGWSIQSELLTLWTCIVMDTRNVASQKEDDEMRTYMQIIELLGQAGVVLAGLLMKINNETKEQFKSVIKVTWRRCHFTADGNPEQHVLSVIRGMRHIREDVLACCGYKRPETTVLRIISPPYKAKYWSMAVESARQWDSNDDDDAWRKPIRDVILLAAAPRSRRNHHLFPVAVRQYVRELLQFGKLLERRGGTSSVLPLAVSKVSLSEIFEVNVIPFVVG